MKKHWIRCWSELSDIIASCGMVGRHRVRWTHTDPEEIDDNTEHMSQYNFEPRSKPETPAAVRAGFKFPPEEPDSD